MNLIERADKMMGYSYLDQSSMEAYIESLCFASKSEIVKLLEHVDERYEMQFPFWARLLAFRFALLQSPDDPELLEWAGAMLRTYGGPDYDDIANDYLQKADEIKKKNQARD